MAVCPEALSSLLSLLSECDTHRRVEENTEASESVSEWKDCTKRDDDEKDKWVRVRDWRERKEERKGILILPKGAKVRLNCQVNGARTFKIERWEEWDEYEDEMFSVRKREREETMDSEIGIHRDEWVRSKEDSIYQVMCLGGCEGWTALN